MFSKFFQRLRHQAFAVLFGIVLISACTISAGAVVTDSSGDGMSLYNGVLLPNLPDWDTSVYPYALINVLPRSVLGGEADAYQLLLCSRPIGVLDDGSVYFWGYDVNTGGTQGASIDAGTTSIRSDYMNYVCPVDSTTAEIASSVYGIDFPVNEWTVAYSTNTGGYTLLRTPPDVLWANHDVYLMQPGGVDDRFWFKSNTIVCVASDPIPSSGSEPEVPPVEDGSGDLDFSLTSLTSSNPQYDYQSAEFDVSWSNLPVVPYPDNVQYFIQGCLNDGAASQPPEIYLGSSSDPPSSDVPVSFSFSGLQPETQYTATFELVYNTTGSFRDFTRSGVTTSVSFTTLSDGSISEGDKAIINAIQQGNKDNQQWTDSQFGSAVGDLPEDTSETDNLISGLDQQEEAYKDDAYDRFQELSSAFSGFDGSVGSGIGLAGTLFTRFYRALGSYQIIYTFPLLLGLAMVLIGRLGRSSIRMEREPGDQFKIDGW